MDYIPPFNGDPEDVYINRNPSTGTPGSKVPAQIFNDIQAELLNVITGAGLTPSDDDLTQLFQAVQALSNFNIASLTEEAAIEMADFLPFLDVDVNDERKLTAAALLSRFMGGRMVIAADADWNALVTPGMYNTTGSGYSNAPLGAVAHPGTLWIIGRSQSTNHATQMFFYSAATPALWSRTTTDGGANWSVWKQVGEMPYGSIINSAYAEVRTGLTGGGAGLGIPVDNTPPLITEGTEIISASLTPKSATNRIRVRVNGYAGGANNSQEATIAFFKNANAEAIFAQHIKMDLNAQDSMAFTAEFEFVAGTTSPLTISVRFGKSSTGTWQINGTIIGDLYGGKSALTLILEEIKA